MPLSDSRDKGVCGEEIAATRYFTPFLSFSVPSILSFCLTLAFAVLFSLLTSDMESHSLIKENLR